MKRFFEYLSPTIEAEQKNTRTHITLVKAMTDGLFSLFRPITETLALADAWLKHYNQSARKNILITATKTFTKNNIPENASMSVIKNAIINPQPQQQNQAKTGPTNNGQTGTIVLNIPNPNKAAELQAAELQAAKLENTQKRNDTQKRCNELGKNAGLQQPSGESNNTTRFTRQ